MQYRQRAPLGVVLVAVTALAAIGAPAVSAAGPSSTIASSTHDHATHRHGVVPPDEPARGLVYKGLVPGRPGGRCEGTLELESKPGVCTHGPDPAPPGVDVRTYRAPLAGPTDRTAAAGGDSADSTTPPFADRLVPCVGNGTSGNRVQAIYARASNVPSAAAAVRPSIRTWAGHLSTALEGSAAKTGGGRQVRWVTTPPAGGACELEVPEVILSPTGDDSFSNTMNELQALGYASSDRKYLVWMDANQLCGMGEITGDDSPARSNRSNGSYSATPDAGMVARVDRACWGWNGGHSVPLHELVHNLGAVNYSAPNTTGLGHCTDDGDTMCYDDGSGSPIFGVCPDWHEAYLDCNDDDYLHSAPAAGSYLHGHWNIGDSAFLEQGRARPTWPRSAAATAGESSVTVGWTAPRYTGGSPVTGYLVTAQPGGTTVAAAAGATSAVVPRLVNGTPYSFTVRAFNRDGGGPGTLAGVRTPGVRNITRTAGTEYPTTDPTIATQTDLSPSALVVAPDGSFYVGDDTRVRRVTKDGAITLVAGNGTTTTSGDGGPATAAGIGTVSGLALDASGRLYLAAPYEARIRRVGTDGVITTVAGGGAGGDGSLATSAALDGPQDVAVDTQGRIFIVETSTSRVRVVGTDGIITPFAGNGVYAFTPDDYGDNGLAIEASLRTPVDVAVDGVGNVLIADPYAGAIRKVGTNGVITRIAGTGTPGSSSGDGGQATAAAIDADGVAVDGAGNILISDTGNHRLRRVGTNGVITTIAGTGIFGSSMDDVQLPADVAQPTDVGASGGDVLFVEPAYGFVRTLLGLSPVTAPTTSAPVAPSAPTGVSATPIVQGAVIAWVPPTNGGSPVTGYTITASPGGATMLVPASLEMATWVSLDPSITYVFTIVATNAVGPSPASAPSNPAQPLLVADGTYVPVTPSRILDTRSSFPGVLYGGVGRTVQVTGLGGVPLAGVSTLVMNVTATQSTFNTFISVAPQLSTTTSNLNVTAGTDVANQVIVPVDANGGVVLYNNVGSVHIIFDVVGYFAGPTATAPGSCYTPVNPARILDTRTGTGWPGGKVGPQSTILVDVTGPGGVPATGVRAVTLNVTVTQPTASGYVSVTPQGGSDTSSVNFLPGRDVPNLVTVPVGTDGNVRIYNAAGTTHVIADVVGWYGEAGAPSGYRFTPKSPSRILDTRNSAPVGPAATRTAPVVGISGIPGSGVVAIAMNVTITQPTATGYVSVTPAGGNTTSTVNYRPGQDIPNMTVVPVGGDGAVRAYNSIGTTHVLFDAVGWFS